MAYAFGATIYKFSENNLSNPNFVATTRVPLKVDILPNTVKDKLNISIEFPQCDHIVIELYDVTGRLLKSLKRDIIEISGVKNYSFDFPYPSVNYMINLHNDTGRQSLKFIK